MIMEKLPPEVLIYVQNVRKYFTNNVETREYFGIDSHGEEFFDGLVEQAHKNYEETGEPQLSVDQFEKVRAKVSKTPEMYGVFVSLGKFGLVSLN